MARGRRGGRSYGNQHGQTGGGGVRKRTPESKPKQTSLKLGEIVEVDAVRSRDGRKLYVHTGGKPVLIDNPQDLSKYSGPIKITAMRGRTANAIMVARDQKTIDDVVNKPAEKTEPDRPTLRLGNLGAGTNDQVTVYVDEHALGLSVYEAIPYLIQNGAATTPRGETILTGLRKSTAANPVYDVPGIGKRSKMTLGDYLKKHTDSYVGIDEKDKPQPPSRSDVGTPKKKSRSRSGGRGKRRAPAAIGVSSRSPGGALYQTTPPLDRMVEMYRK